MEYLSITDDLFVHRLPFTDVNQSPMIYLDDYVTKNFRIIKAYSAETESCMKESALIDEIYCTLLLEKITTDKDTIHTMIHGKKACNKEELRICAVYNALMFISDLSNTITKESLYTLYNLVYAVPPVNWNCEEILAFINESPYEELTTAAILHYAVLYRKHNGILARLVHLWYLIQNGFLSAVCVPFSGRILEYEEEYHASYTLIESNYNVSLRIDSTPFVQFFHTSLYNQSYQPKSVIQRYTETDSHLFTNKERLLWDFVVSAYGTQSFTTKQLEKDYGNVAYATVRSFVLKFTELRLLKATQLSTKVLYRISK
ncbi:MAG: hypothetical protein HUJ58_02510 [Erysipelotrichaceae bacterium]|nr:hypothetical protein [Erysipelotrichaceae bacterium]